MKTQKENKFKLEDLRKEDLIKTFNYIIELLIKKELLKYYPFKKNIKYLNKKMLIEGIQLYSKKFKEVKK